MTNNFYQPLVSIVIVTYNSSKFILETLESVKDQSYQNIELIVSDDCSTDSTIDIVSIWIEKNNGRFQRTKIVKVNENTGIPSNLNRGLNVAKGEWIKYLAGDDLLLTDCILDNVNFISCNPGCFFIFSNTILFRNSEDKELQTSEKNQNFNLSAKKQFEKLLIENWVFSISCFMHRESLVNIGGYDTQLRILDDYPLWLRVTYNKYKLCYLEKTTTKYRIHENSITEGMKQSNNLNGDLLKTFFKYQLPHINLKNSLYFWNTYLDLKYYNRKNNLIMIISPLYLLSSIRHKIEATLNFKKRKNRQ